MLEKPNEENRPMRVTTLLRKLIDVSKIVVDGFAFEEISGDLVIEVRPSWWRSRCGCCGKKGPRYDRRDSPRRWRHLNLGKTKIYLEYAVYRVNCPTCGIRTEQVPWARHDSDFTIPFEELVAYLSQVADRKAVATTLGVVWRTVGKIVERVVAERLDPARFDNLRCIGVDEISYKKRHKYLTTVVDHDRRRIIWAAPGKTSDTLLAFFDELDPKQCEKIKLVTIDMSQAYMAAIREALPHAQIVFDRFHVQKLAGDAIDKIRREQQRELRGTDAAKELFASRYSLQKNPWNLSRVEEDRLANVQRANVPLFRAYLLKETLARVLDYKQPWRAERALRDWLAWASRSRLQPFVDLARTIRLHFDGILAYVRYRVSNGRVEGFHNRIRMLMRRAFGFHDPCSVIAMALLCCGGIPLHPPLPSPSREPTR
jgi:transposase